MRKLWAKQVFRDLVVINYGCEGLAENFYKTHEIVLMKGPKVRVRSAKDQVGAGLYKDLTDLEGFSGDFARHKENSGNCILL